MPLEAVLGEIYEADLTLKIWSEPHTLMIESVEALDKYNLILRMREYYEDSKYEPSEIPELQRELQSLRHELELNPLVQKQVEEIKAGIATRIERPFMVTIQDFYRLIRRLELLCQIAIEEGKSIELLAD